MVRLLSCVGERRGFARYGRTSLLALLLACQLACDGEQVPQRLRIEGDSSAIGAQVIHMGATLDTLQMRRFEGPNAIVTKRTKWWTGVTYEPGDTTVRTGDRLAVGRVYLVAGWQRLAFVSPRQDTIHCEVRIGGTNSMYVSFMHGKVDGTPGVRNVRVAPKRVAQ